MEYFGRFIRLIYVEGNFVYLRGITTFSNVAIPP